MPATSIVASRYVHLMPASFSRPPSALAQRSTGVLLRVNFNGPLNAPCVHVPLNSAPLSVPLYVPPTFLTASDTLDPFCEISVIGNAMPSLLMMTPLEVPSG